MAVNKKALLAELTGTGFLTFMILSAIQNTKGWDDSNSAASFWMIIITHAFALALVAFVFGPLSGGHVNPAVSLAVLIAKKMMPLDFALYVIAQLCGGFIGAALTHGLYMDFSDARCKADWNACGYANEKKAGLNSIAAFCVEAIGTQILCIGVLATADKHNENLPTPISKVTLLMASIALPGLAFGTLTGFAINPARDLGPRLFSWIFFGKSVWASGFYWIPVAGPMFGAVLAGICYYVFRAPKKEILPSHTPGNRHTE